MFVLGSFALGSQSSKSEQGSTDKDHAGGQHRQANGTSQSNHSSKGTDGGSSRWWNSGASGQKAGTSAGAGGSSGSMPQAEEDEAEQQQDDDDDAYGVTTARLKPIAKQYPGATGEVARILDARCVCGIYARLMQPTVLPAGNCCRGARRPRGRDMRHLNDCMYLLA